MPSSVLGSQLGLLRWQDNNSHARPLATVLVEEKERGIMLENVPISRVINAITTNGGQEGEGQRKD